MRQKQTGSDVKRKFNLIDWLLILPLLVGILLLGGSVWQRRKSAGDEISLVCVMRIAGVERSLLETHGQNLIPEGSILRNSNGTVILGSVKHVSLTDHLTAVFRSGQAELTSDPDFADLEVTVHMRPARFKSGDGLRVGDLRIAAGGSGSFRFGSYYAAQTELISVEVRPA